MTSSTQTSTVPDNARVTLDGITSFPCHLPDTRWNGWARPRFSRPVAEAFIRWNAEQGLSAEDEHLSWHGDVIASVVPARGGTTDYLAADRDWRYSIGEGWCWYEVDRDDHGRDLCERQVRTAVSAYDALAGVSWRLELDGGDRGSAVYGVERDGGWRIAIEHSDGVARFEADDLLVTLPTLP